MQRVQQHQVNIHGSVDNSTPDTLTGTSPAQTAATGHL